MPSARVMIPRYIMIRNAGNSEIVTKLLYRYKVLRNNGISVTK